jgi:hypothetical protein
MGVFMAVEGEHIEASVQPIVARPDLVVVPVAQVAGIPRAVRKLHLGEPGPVAVLVGGSGDLSAEDQKQLYEIFINGLVPLAQALDIRIVDGGADRGLERLLGQAYSALDASFP